MNKIINESLHKLLIETFQEQGISFVTYCKAHFKLTEMHGFPHLLDEYVHSFDIYQYCIY